MELCKLLVALHGVLYKNGKLPIFTYNVLKIRCSLKIACGHLVFALLCSLSGAPLTLCFAFDRFLGCGGVRSRFCPSSTTTQAQTLSPGIARRQARQTIDSGPFTFCACTYFKRVAHPAGPRGWGTASFWSTNAQNPNSPFVFVIF